LRRLECPQQVLRISVEWIKRAWLKMNPLQSLRGKKPRSCVMHPATEDSLNIELTLGNRLPWFVLCRGRVSNMPKGLVEHGCFSKEASELDLSVIWKNAKLSKKTATWKIATRRKRPKVLSRRWTWRLKIQNANSNWIFQLYLAYFSKSKPSWNKVEIGS